MVAFVTSPVVGPTWVNVIWVWPGLEQKQLSEGQGPGVSGRLTQHGERSTRHVVGTHSRGMHSGQALGSQARGSHSRRPLGGRI